MHKTSRTHVMIWVSFSDVGTSCSLRWIHSANQTFLSQVDFYVCRGASSATCQLHPAQTTAVKRPTAAIRDCFGRQAFLPPSQSASVQDNESLCEPVLATGENSGRCSTGGAGSCRGTAPLAAPSALLLAPAALAASDEGDRSMTCSPRF